MSVRKESVPMLSEAKTKTGLSLIMVSCKHISLDMNGNCIECGMECEQLFGTEGPVHNAPKGNERSILKDMENIAVPDEIKIKAEEIFNKLNATTKRGNRRKQLVFFCIYNAYNELGYPQDPKQIAILVGIKNSEMTKALSMCSEAQTGYKPPSVQITALDLLPQYCENLGLRDDTVPDVIEFAMKILAIDTELNETFPQKVAAGILLYYATINGIKIDKKEYAKMIQLSEVTINSMYKQVARIDNSGGK